MKTIDLRFALTATFVLGLAPTACDQDEDPSAKQLVFNEDAALPTNSLPAGPTEINANLLDEEAVASECKWHCKPCPPNKLCTQECFEIGNCNSECGIMAKCIAGYVWSDQACNCLPDPNADEVCGAVTCPNGTECCNSSCGVCVEPGGVCTQQVCDPAA